MSSNRFRPLAHPSIRYGCEQHVDRDTSAGSNSGRSTTPHIVFDPQPSLRFSDLKNAQTFSTAPPHNQSMFQVKRFSVLPIYRYEHGAHLFACNKTVYHRPLLCTEVEQSCGGGSEISIAAILSPFNHHPNYPEMMRPIWTCHWNSRKTVADRAEVCLH